MTEIGFIGLGRMGGNMVNRMVDAGNVRTVIWNRTQSKMDEYVAKGAIPSTTISELVSKLEEDKKVIWLMLPSGEPTQKAFDEVLNLLSKGDVIVNGANSNFHDSIKMHATAKKAGIGMLDVGVSGGIVAAKTGYPMMIGGEQEVYDYVKPIFASFGLEGGYNLCGAGGSGHYVKMIHNAIEYGMMQAIGEGFEVMKKAPEFEIDLESVVGVYNHGSVIESSLIGWLADGFKKYGTELEEVSGEVSHSGEGLWTVEAAKRIGVPVPIIEGSLRFREDSQGNPSYTGKVVSVQRNMFGGHDVTQNKEA